MFLPKCGFHRSESIFINEFYSLHSFQVWNTNQRINFFVSISIRLARWTKFLNFFLSFAIRSFMKLEEKKMKLLLSWALEVSQFNAIYIYIESGLSWWKSPLYSIPLKQHLLYCKIETNKWFQIEIHYVSMSMG